MTRFLLPFVPRLLAFRNMVRGRDSRRTVILWTLLGLTILGGVHDVSRRLVAHIDSIDRIAPALSILHQIHSLLVDDPPTFGEMLNRFVLLMLLSTLVTMLLFSNVIIALSTFFDAEELDLLFASPLPYERLFTARFLETMIRSSWMVILLLAPFLLALGRVYQAPPRFLFTFWVPLLPLIAGCTALGILISFGLVKILTVRHARRLLQVAVLAVTGLLLIGLRMMRPELLVSTERLVGLLMSLETSWNPWLERGPPGWATQEILLLMDHSWSGARPEHPLLWVLTLTALTVCLVVARRFHTPLWQDHQEARGAHRQIVTDVRDRPEPALARLLVPRWMSRPVWEILVKDARVFGRSPIFWTQAYMLGVIIVIYLSSFLYLDLESLPGMTQVFIDLIAGLNGGVVAFVTISLAARFALPGFSLDGRAFQLIRASPCGLAPYVRLRFLTQFALLGILSEGLVLASCRLMGASPRATLLVMADTLLLDLGIVALALAFGAAFRNARVQNWSEVPSSLGAMLFMLAALAMLLVTLGLQGHALHRLSFRARVPGTFAWVVEILHVVLPVLGSVAIPLLVTRQAYRWTGRALAEAEQD